jgi:hypothetical protein
MAFASVGTVVIALPWVWQRTPESWRFEAGRTERAERGRLRELPAPAWRRRSVGLWLAAVMRGAALGGLGFYSFHHAVASLGLPAWQAAAVFAGAGCAPPSRGRTRSATPRPRRSRTSASPP